MSQSPMVAAAAASSNTSSALNLRMLRMVQDNKDLIHQPSTHKDWHDQISLEERIYQITTILQAVFPKLAPALLDSGLKRLLHYFCTLEGNCFKRANDKREYYHLLSENRSTFPKKVEKHLQWIRSIFPKVVKHLQWMRGQNANGAAVSASTAASHTSGSQEISAAWNNDDNSSSSQMSQSPMVAAAAASSNTSSALNLRMLRMVQDNKDLIHQPSTHKDWHDQISLEERIYQITTILRAIFPKLASTFLGSTLKKLLHFVCTLEGHCFERANDKREYYHLLSENRSTFPKKVEKHLQWIRSIFPKVVKHLQWMRGQNANGAAVSASTAASHTSGSQEISAAWNNDDNSSSSQMSQSPMVAAAAANSNTSSALNLRMLRMVQDNKDLIHQPSTHKDWHDQISLEERIYQITTILQAVFPKLAPALLDSGLKRLLHYFCTLEGNCFKRANDKREYYHLLSENRSTFPKKVEKHLQWIRSIFPKVVKHLQWMRGQNANGAAVSASTAASHKRDESVMTSHSSSNKADPNLEEVFTNQMEYLMAILPQFLQLVDPVKSGLEDEMRSCYIIDSEEEENINAGTNRRDRARAFWKSMHKVPPELFQAKVYPVLKEKCSLAVRGKVFLWNGQGDSMSPCLRHIVQRRMTLRKFADIFPTTGSCTFEEYRKITEGGDRDEGLWSEVFALCRRNQDNTSFRKKLRSTLTDIHCHVPDDLQTMLAQGFPCLCHSPLTAARPSQEKKAAKRRVSQVERPAVQPSALKAAKRRVSQVERPAVQPSALKAFLSLPTAETGSQVESSCGYPSTMEVISSSEGYSVSIKSSEASEHMEAEEDPCFLTPEQKESLLGQMDLIEFAILQASKIRTLYRELTGIEQKLTILRQKTKPDSSGEQTVSTEDTELRNEGIVLRLQKRVRKIQKKLKNFGKVSKSKEQAEQEKKTLTELPFRYKRDLQARKQILNNELKEAAAFYDQSLALCSKLCVSNTQT